RRVPGALSRGRRSAARDDQGEPEKRRRSPMQALKSLALAGVLLLAGATPSPAAGHAPPPYHPRRVVFKHRHLHPPLPHQPPPHLTTQRRPPPPPAPPPPPSSTPRAGRTTTTTTRTSGSTGGAAPSRTTARRCTRCWPRSTARGRCMRSRKGTSRSPARCRQ